MDRPGLDELPVGVLTLAADGTVVDSNAWFTSWFGSEVVGQRFDELLVVADDFLVGAGRLSRMMAHASAPGRIALVVREGSVATVMDAADRYDAGQRLRASLGLADRTRNRLELVIDASIAFAGTDSEERLAQVLADTAARSYRAESSVVLLADDDGRLIRAAGTNPFDGLMSSIGAAALRIQQVVKITGADEAAALSPQLGAAMRETGVQALIAAPLHTVEGNLGVFACFFHHHREFDDEAAPLADALAGQAAQALAALRLQRKLSHAATHDETTALPNRRYLEDHLPTFDGAEQVATIFIDLDGFKAVNDQLGHDVGDRVLREVGRRLRAATRDDDIVARYGGDEFVVVCRVDVAERAVDLAHRLRAALEVPYDFLPVGITLGASLGVASGRFTSAAASIDGFIRQADQAMYVAKSAGGNAVVLA